MFAVAALQQQTSAAQTLAAPFPFAVCLFDSAGGRNQTGASSRPRRVYGYAGRPTARSGSLSTARPMSQLRSRLDWFAWLPPASLMSQSHLSDDTAVRTLQSPQIARRDLSQGAPEHRKRPLRRATTYVCLCVGRLSSTHTHTHNHNHNHKRALRARGLNELARAGHSFIYWLAITRARKATAQSISGHVFCCRHCCDTRRDVITSKVSAAPPAGS